MLQLTIVLGVVLFASVVIVDTSVFGASKAMYLRQIETALLKIAESRLNDSSLPDEISSKLDDEISMELSHAEVDLKELRSQKKAFEVIHPSVNISDCIQLYNQAAEKLRSTLHNTYACSLKRLQMYYITDAYNDIMREIDLCKGNFIFRYFYGISRCYLNARHKVLSFLPNSDEINLQMIKPDEFHVQWSLDYCKDDNTFSAMKPQILTVTDSAKECINARWNVTL